MLKIKDDIDLKELEKFGFEKDLKGNYTLSIDDKETNERLFGIDTMYDFIFLKVWKYSRELQVTFQDMQDYFSMNMDVIFDLIDAGLVEKVGDVNE